MNKVVYKDLEQYYITKNKYHKGMNELIFATIKITKYEKIENNNIN